MTKDPFQDKKKEISERVSHGGCCYYYAEVLVVSIRGGGVPGGRNLYRGFRIVRNVKEKTC